MPITITTPEGHVLQSEDAFGALKQLNQQALVGEPDAWRYMLRVAERARRSSGIDIRTSSPALFLADMSAAGLLEVAGLEQSGALGPPIHRQAQEKSLDLSKILVEQLGISETQAQGGVGAMFNLAKSQLDAGDFDRLAGFVPGIESMMASAPDGGALGQLGGLGGMLGGQAGKLASLAALAGSFGRLDMDPTMIQRFAPLVVDYLREQGGDAAVGILERVLS